MADIELRAGKSDIQDLLWGEGAGSGDRFIAERIFTVEL